MIATLPVAPRSIPSPSRKFRPIRADKDRRRILRWSKPRQSEADIRAGQTTALNSTLAREVRCELSNCMWLAANTSSSITPRLTSGGPHESDPARDPIIPVPLESAPQARLATAAVNSNRQNQEGLTEPVSETRRVRRAHVLTLIVYGDHAC